MGDRRTLAGVSVLAVKQFKAQMKKYGAFFKSTSIILISCFVTVVFGSCICAGIAYGRYWVSYQNDKAAIRVRYNECHQATHNQDYARTYACMTPDYRQNHSIQEFIDNPVFIAVEELQAEFSVINAPGGHIEVLPENPRRGWLVGPGYELVEVEGQWFFTGNSSYYVD